MATSTVEQYLKTLFNLKRRSVGVVRMKELADAMEVTPGTATAMVKHLDRQGLVEYTPWKGSVLSKKGEALAIKILRRHRLIETFLEKVLGYDWAEVHAEAEQLEHAVSELFIERIDALMGRPANDPHGFPIPSAYGVIDSEPFESLATLDNGTRVVIVKLSDETSEFLTLMKEHGLKPGERFVVIQNSSASGVVTVRSETTGADFTLSREIADKVHVRNTEG